MKAWLIKKNICQIKLFSTPDPMMMGENCEYLKLQVFKLLKFLETRLSVHLNLDGSLISSTNRCFKDTCTQDVLGMSYLKFHKLFRQTQGIQLLDIVSFWQLRIFPVSASLKMKAILLNILISPKLSKLVPMLLAFFGTENFIFL